MSSFAVNSDCRVVAGSDDAMLQVWAPARVLEDEDEGLRRRMEEDENS